jgi:probable rRNA maturation factor
MRVTLSKPVRLPRWKDRQRYWRVLHEASALTGLESVPGFGVAAELHVILVGSRTMARLNAAYCGHQGRTDVLTFGLGETGGVPGPVVAGEIYICPDVAAVAAGRFGTSLGEECVLYAVHGMLHLAGFDDGEPGARRAMRQAERRVMGRLRARTDFGAIFADSAAS